MEFKEAGKLWVRYVSPTPATSFDVSLLKELMDKRLETSKARSNGICPMRETLFQQCFDELIRQITIHCAERGFLLVRVRDEFRQQLSCFQALYDSSIAYGMRHALIAEASKAEKKQKIDSLNKECNDLENLISDLETLCKEKVKHFEEDLAEEADKH